MKDKKNLEKEKKPNEKNKKGKKKKVIAILIFLLILFIAFLIWFFNRKFEVVFDYNNGSTEEIIYVRYGRKIKKEDLKYKEELGDNFIDWYEVRYNEKKEEVVNKEPFDFDTKIKMKTRLKALYKGESKPAVTPTPTPKPTTKPKADPVETISLSVTNKYVTNQGTITTSKAVAKTANAKGNPKFTLNDTECANINETTGEVTVRTNINWRMPYYRKCFFDGTTLTVTATLPSGKSATAQIIIEPRLKVSAYGIDTSLGVADGTPKLIEASSPHTDYHLYYFTDRSNTYTANQSVTWNAEIHSSIVVSKTDKTYTYTFNNNSSRSDITVSATTAAGQKTTIKSSQLVN